VKDSLKTLKLWPKKFDLLFGFTHSFKDYDCWMHDPECGWGDEIYSFHQGLLDA
jgi:hypothetical protein